MWAKWTSLSDYVKELKQSFSRWYNKHHGRKGFFWGERFKSVLVDNGDTLINCLAYIDLNPVRAGLVERPEDYRWCSLAYHVQTGNKDDFLSLDFGLTTFSNGDATTRLRYYRRYVYENGAQAGTPGAPIDPQLVDREAQKGFALTPVDRLLYRIRYFTDSGVIGTKTFVSRCKNGGRCRVIQVVRCPRGWRTTSLPPAVPGGPPRRSAAPAALTPAPPAASSALAPPAPHTPSRPGPDSRPLSAHSP